MLGISEEFSFVGQNCCIWAVFSIISVFLCSILWNFWPKWIENRFITLTEERSSSEIFQLIFSQESFMTFTSSQKSALGSWKAYWRALSPGSQNLRKCGYQTFSASSSPFSTWLCEARAGAMWNTVPRFPSQLDSCWFLAVGDTGERWKCRRKGEKGLCSFQLPSAFPLGQLKL